MKAPTEKTQNPADFKWTPLHHKLATSGEVIWTPTPGLAFTGRQTIHGLQDPVMLQPIDSRGAVRIGFRGHGRAYVLEVLALSIPSIADTIQAYGMLNDVPPPGDDLTWELQDPAAPVWGTVSGIEIHKETGSHRCSVLLAPHQGAITEGLQVMLDARHLRALGGLMAALYAAMTDEQREARVMRLHHVGAAIQVSADEESPTIGELQRRAKKLAGEPRGEGAR